MIFEARLAVGQFKMAGKFGFIFIYIVLHGRLRKIKNITCLKNDIERLKLVFSISDIKTNQELYPGRFLNTDGSSFPFE